MSFTQNYMTGCIPVRINIALVMALIMTDKLSQNIYCGVNTIIGLGFLGLWLTNSRMNAPEASGGITWWASNRWVHGLFYLMAAATWVATKDPIKVGIVIVVDIIFSILYYARMLRYDVTINR